MDLKKGLIVRSKAGRDKGEFFVVIELNEDFAFIADGKTRKLDKLKKKNNKHLFLTNSLINLNESITDKKIRTALRNFKSNK